MKRDALYYVSNRALIVTMSFILFKTRLPFLCGCRMEIQTNESFIICIGIPADIKTVFCAMLTFTDRRVSYGKSNSRRQLGRRRKR